VDLSNKNFIEYLGKNKESIIFALALLLAIASAIYWIAILTHAYNTFADGSGDLYLYSYNMYFNLHYPSIANGLQFIVTSNHISPDVLLIMPIYYLYQHSIVLIYLQTIVICLTSFIVFYAARKLIKDSTLALLLSMAFLLNPGVTGILAFDFHIEFLLVPTYILTFYFYMTSNRKLFWVSLALLLGSMEVAPLLSLTLGLGLIAYELSVSKASGKSIDKIKKSMLTVLIISSIVAGIFYFAAIRYLIASYKTSYSQLPEPLQVNTGSEVSLLSDVHSILSQPSLIITNLSLFEKPVWLYLLILSLLIVLFGFGFFTLKKLHITLLLLLPWFIVVLTWSLGVIHFIYTGYQYYSFTIGATIAASIIGAAFAIDKLKKQRKYNPDKKALIYSSVLGAAILFAVLSLMPAAKPLTFAINYNRPVTYPIFNYSQIDPLMNLIPQNASVLTQDEIIPHLAEREYIEYSSSHGMNISYFAPDYILISYNNQTQVYTNTSYYDFFERSMSDYNYTLQAQDGNARLYKRT
jgi:uncharacterized membrane protein